MEIGQVFYGMDDVNDQEHQTTKHFHFYVDVGRFEIAANTELKTHNRYECLSEGCDDKNYYKALHI